MLPVKDMQYWGEICVDIPTHFISNIEKLRQQLRDIPQNHTLTMSYYHHAVLDETISIYKQGYRFMPVVGASAVVEACLQEQKRGDETKRREDQGEPTTLKKRFKQHSMLGPLIKMGTKNPLIPIAELLDEDETLDSILNGKSTKFAGLRNKFAHGDIMLIMWVPKEFYSYLPPKDELEQKYEIKLSNNSVRMDIPGYVQLTKCLNFLIKWRENLIAR